MFGSTVLEIGIGLMFIYLVLSLVCSKINEYIASHLLSWRASTLETAIINMLGDPKLKEELYQHPLINSLHSLQDKTSYIPSHLFSLALLDIVDQKTGSNFVRGSGSNTTGLASVDTPKGKQDSDNSQPSSPLAGAPEDQPDPLLDAEGKPVTLPHALGTKTLVPQAVQATNPVTPAEKDIAAIDQRVNALTTALTHAGIAPNLTRALTVFVNDAEADADKIRKNVEGWFNETMERASGVYKRKTQIIILGLALLAALLSNADTIMIVNRLSHQTTLRAQATAAADQIVRQMKPGETKPGETPTLDATQLNQLDTLIGWSSDPKDERHYPGYRQPAEQPQTTKQPQTTNQLQTTFTWPEFFEDLLFKMIGLLITTFAVSMGAPFWFDMLGKFVNMRNAGRNPTEPPKNQGKTPPANSGNA